MQTMSQPNLASMPVQRVTAQLASELRVLGQTLGAVEHAIELLVANSHDTDPRTIHGLQTIDLLGQSLVALARFMDEIVPQIEPGWVIDVENAVRGVPLSALADRLRLSNRTAATDFVDAGVEFFS